jgi:transcriptional regulator with XRE-family HTH domain/tetratricopeptide (TPR) repeat protein
VKGAWRFLSERLASARVDLGLTQEQAAMAVGVDVRTYRRYESGEVNEGGFTLGRASRREILAKFARELGLEPEDLIEEERPPTEPVRSTGLESPHVLPRAPRLIAREPLESTLVRWLRREDWFDVHVVVVHAMGGAGKTSLLARALERAETAEVFVWSFYEDRRVEAFLGALARTASSRADLELTERVLSGLREAPAPLLVLDGLEVMQADGESGSGRALGELEDPRMRLLLRHFARGVGATRVMITTRTPLPDLEGWIGTSVAPIALPPMGDREIRAVLSEWGLDGAKAPSELLRGVGGHALSASVVASLASHWGLSVLDPLRFELGEEAQTDALAARLSRMLTRYGESMSALDRDVMRRASTLPRGIDLETLVRLSRGSEEVAGMLRARSSGALRASLRRLCARGLLSPEGRLGRVAAHPFVRQHFQRELGRASRAVHEDLRRAAAASLTSHGGASTEGAPLETLESLLEHTLRAGDGEEAFRLYSNALGGFSHLGLRLGEMSRGLRITRLFATDPETGGFEPLLAESILSPSATARIHYDRGLFLGALGDLEAALDAYATVLDVALRAGDLGFQMTVLRTEAYTRMLRGETDAAQRAASRSVELARRFDSKADQIRGTALLGAIASHAGERDTATELFRDARALGDEPIARRALWEAEHELGCGEIERAVRSTEQNLVACRRLGWEGHVAHCHALLCRAQLVRGERATARSELESALPWTRRSFEAEMTLRTAELRLALADTHGPAEEDLLMRGTELASIGGFRIFRAFVDSAGSRSLDLRRDRR